MPAPTAELGSDRRAPGPRLVSISTALAGGGAVATAIGLAAMFVWMTPQAAAREISASCAALNATPTNPALGALPTLAPDFTAQGHDGRSIKLSDYRGQVVVVNFWASWCNVCQSEKPSLAAMTRELGQPGFSVVTLASDRSWDEVKKALPTGAPFQVLLDPPTGDETLGSIASAWGIKAVPETFVIDKQGRIRMYLVNKRVWDSAVARTCLQALIDE